MPKMYKSYGAIFSLTVTAIGHVTPHMARNQIIPEDSLSKNTHEFW